MPMHRFPVRTPVLLTLLLFGAVTLLSVETGPVQAASRPMVWPAPPAAARIRFVRSISNPGNLGNKPHLLRRFFNVITGKKDKHFIRPTGVAARDGIIYVADMGGQALWILDTVHDRSIEVHDAGTNPLLAPAAVAVRADGAVYLADSLAKQVYLIDDNGKFLGIAAADGLQRPAGVAYDERDGRLYVADSKEHAVVVFAADGKKILSWGRRGSADGEFNYPTHISIDRQGRILVTDALNFRVQAFDRDGKFLWKFGRHGDGSGDLSSPKGVATDSAGHVYLVDALFDTVQIFNTNGQLLLAFGERGTGTGQFWLPGGIYIDTGDHIYVCDSYNHRIQIFNYLGGDEPPQPQD